MRSEKGVTLSTVIIYLVLFLIVISILTTVSKSFYSNVNYITDTGKYLAEFNKFNMYFIEDVKSNKEITSCSANKIVFASGDVYTFENNNVYKNKTKICGHITNLTFSTSQETDDNDFTKTIVTVHMEVTGSKPFEVEEDYVLRYW